MRVVFAVSLLASCFYPEKQFTGATGDAKTPDGVAPLTDVPRPDSDAGSCFFAPSYSPTFAGSAENADNEGSQAPYTQIIEWAGQLPVAQQFLVVEAESGGGTTGNQATPDWPIGDITPKSDIGVTGSGSAQGDMQVFLAGDVNGSGDIGVLYLAITGSVSITEVSPDFAGTGMNLVFQHVNADTGSADPDNCMSFISSFSFDAPLEAVPP
jgi:hypothetical protein